MTPLTLSGLDDVAVERYRQIDYEGYGAAHDDTHVDGELASAAYCILFEHTQGPGCVDDEDEPDDWIQALALKLRSVEPMRRLTVAAALLVAEIDRLRRESGQAVNYEKAGVLEVGQNAAGEVVVQFPSFLSWVAFTPEQAREFALKLGERVAAIRAGARG
jgi:hypothetical protein